MNILILSVTAGYGHHATAKALEEVFRKKGATVKTLDVYDYLNKLLHDTISTGYLISSKYTPVLYRVLYTLAENKNTEAFYPRFNTIHVVNALSSIKFEKILDDFQPDAILCTHVFAAQLIDEMKKRNMIKVPAIGIITDYTVHPFWEDVSHVEYIVTASELITHLAIKRGIALKRILPFGIPIHPKFSIPYTMGQARQMLNLNLQKPVALVMSGSMGYNNSKKIVEEIVNTEIPFQILALTGNNRRQLKKLQELPHQMGNCTLDAYGFVNNVEVMMSAADCIITKPGGLTVTESIAKNLPMLLVDPIPGQEERNVEFLLNNGIASIVTKTFPLEEALYHMFMNPVRRKTIRETIAAIGHPDAAEKLVDFVLALK